LETGLLEAGVDFLEAEIQWWDPNPHLHYIQARLSR
jgi:hypothetical protein